MLLLLTELEEECETEAVNESDGASETEKLNEVVDEGECEGVGGSVLLPESDGEDDADCDTLVLAEGL